MFDEKLYIPILKWKRAEQGALDNLSEEHKNHIMPLIQFVMPKAESDDKIFDVVLKFEKQSSKIPEKITDTWGTNPVFIDVSLLYTKALKAKSLRKITTEGHKQSGFFIPTIHLGDDQEIQEAAYSIAADCGCGMCLRVVCADFSDTDRLNQALNQILSVSGLEEKNIDLFVDIKETGDNGYKYSKYFRLSQSILNLSKWRTFIFGGGSFPEDLSGCKFAEENLIPRIEWLNWKKHNTGNRLLRKPSFSDYTIQHPVYKEATQFFSPTTSIKYTLDDYWLIKKGKRKEFDKYLANAVELVNDSRYYGRNFSYGDDYVAERAEHLEAYLRNPAIKGTGTAETWLKAGINHHLTLVADQIANLSSR